MEKTVKRGWKVWAACAGIILAVLIFWCTPGTVQAAKYKFRVRINDSYSTIIEKTNGVWALTPKNSANGDETAVLPRGVTYIEAAAGRQLESGYYYVYRNGQIARRKIFRELDTTVNGKRFKGAYYFGGENACLYMKRGWITIGSKRYYLSSSGRKYRNCWRGDYYLDSNGEIARNTRTPDGYYVDCDGKKCKKNEMRLSSLKKSLTSMINSYGGRWSVYVKDLETGDILSINNTTMYPASVIKLFVMASTYDKIQKGSLAQTTYVNSLLTDMITVSDNESFNQLVRLNDKSGSFVNGCKAVNTYLKSIGITATQCHSTLHPSSSSFTSDGQSNVASARDAAILLEKIYKGECVSKKYSKQMLNLLLNQTRRWKIPAGLPSGTKVANKTGETSSYQHDVAIVYGPKTNYIVCIFSQTGESTGIYGIKNLSAKIYSYLNK